MHIDRELVTISRTLKVAEIWTLPTEEGNMCKRAKRLKEFRKGAWEDLIPKALKAEIIGLEAKWEREDRTKETTRIDKMIDNSDPKEVRGILIKETRSLIKIKINKLLRHLHRLNSRLCKLKLNWRSYLNHPELTLKNFLSVKNPKW